MTNPINCHSSLLFVSTEKRQDNGRVYFVNHNTRTTQWDDPRTQGWDCELVGVLTGVCACVCLLVRWWLWMFAGTRADKFSVHRLCFPLIIPGILWNESGMFPGEELWQDFWRQFREIFKMSEFTRTWQNLFFKPTVLNWKKTSTNLYTVAV